MNHLALFIWTMPDLIGLIFWGSILMFVLYQWAKASWRASRAERDDK